MRKLIGPFGIRWEICAVIFVFYFFDCAMLGMNVGLARSSSAEEETLAIREPDLPGGEDAAEESSGAEDLGEKTSFKPEGTVLGEAKRESSSGPNEPVPASVPEESESDSGGAAGGDFGGSGSGGGTDGSEEAKVQSRVEELCESVAESDAGSVYDWLSEDLRSLFSEANVAAAFALVMPEVSSSEIISGPTLVGSSGQFAKAEVRFVFADGSSGDYKVYLVKEDGEWKLMGTEELK